MKQLKINRYETKNKQIVLKSGPDAARDVAHGHDGVGNDKNRDLHDQLQHRNQVLVRRQRQHTLQHRPQHQYVQDIHDANG